MVLGKINTLYSHYRVALAHALPCYHVKIDSIFLICPLHINVTLRFAPL